MNQVKATACKPNQMDYSFEKNSISQCEKKCLAFRGAVHYDLKAVNSNRREEQDTRTPEELLSIIEAQSDEIKNIISLLRNKGI